MASKMKMKIRHTIKCKDQAITTSTMKDFMRWGNRKFVAMYTQGCTSDGIAIKVKLWKHAKGRQVGLCRGKFDFCLETNFIDLKLITKMMKIRLCWNCHDLLPYALFNQLWCDDTVSQCFWYFVIVHFWLHQKLYVWNIRPLRDFELRAPSFMNLKEEL